jgi:hypothetical protein
MNAQEQVAEAIATHGRPMWVAHIPKRIVQEVDKNILKEMLEKAGKSVETMKVRDKYDFLLDWAAENVFEQITTAQMKQMTGLTGVSIRRWIQDHTDTFRKVKNGVWEVRDVKADREADRAKQ